jgi:hypothetical protein
MLKFASWNGTNVVVVADPPFIFLTANVWVARQPPGFAFVEFEDFRDGEVSPYFCFFQEFSI